MKVAIYKDVSIDYETVKDCHYYEDNEFKSEYIRISEIVDVDFPMLEDVDINSKKVELIDDKINKALAVLETLEQQKAELLSIPDMRVSDEK